jgi:hypothetical protein
MNSPQLLGYDRASGGVLIGSTRDAMMHLWMEGMPLHRLLLIHSSVFDPQHNTTH